MNIAVNKTPAELAYDGMLLPHPRLEDWKWTNLRVLIDRPYPPRLKVKAEAKDVERLLKDRPAGIKGIAVPGMPRGSPGMEMPDGARDQFDVIAFNADGKTAVFKA